MQKTRRRAETGNGAMVVFFCHLFCILRDFYYFCSRNETKNEKR